MTRVESSHLIKNVTRVESSQETTERDSSRVRVTKIVTRVESLTRVTTSLENRVPRIREIGSLKIHIGYITCSLKKTLPNANLTLT